MGKILDFGTDETGIHGADWVQELPTDHPGGNAVFAKWIKPGVPIPAADGTYDFINSRWAMTHNPMENWKFILSELARVSAPDGVLAFLESNTEDDDYNMVNVRKAFAEAFPRDDGWVVILKFGCEDADLSFTAYVYRERDV